MAYPFTFQEQHKVYKNTFLQDTYAEIHFDSMTESEWGDGTHLQVYLNKYFHIDSKVAWGDMAKGFSLANKDTDVTLHFSNQVVSVRVGRKCYQSFATSVMPHVFLLKSYAREVLLRNEVRLLAVRKINLWPYSEKETKNQLGSEEILQTLLSNKLREQQAEKRRTADGQVLETIAFQERETSLTIGYGIVEDGDNPVAVLDSMAESEQTQPTGLNDVETKLDELNNILYSAYHWCVSDKVLQWMEGEEVEHV